MTEYSGLIFDNLLPEARNVFYVEVLAIDRTTMETNLGLIYHQVQDMINGELE